jgi:O-antigen ligase
VSTQRSGGDEGGNREDGADSQLSRRLATLAQTAFSLWLVISLCTPSWRYGPFSWLPLLSFPELAGGPVALGVLNFLPALVMASWLGSRLRGQPRPWRWGHPALTVPFLGLSLLSALSLRPVVDRLAFIYLGGLLVAWLVYFYVLNERPLLWPAFAAIIVIQSAVAAGQFFAQGDLGLIALGELPLNPAFEGTSVVVARGRPWLRGYGLTAHPNLLGAMLTLLLLLLLPVYQRARRPLAVILEITTTVGLLGLLASFSRAGWLAFGAGVVIWLVGRLIDRRGQSEEATAPFRFSWHWLLILIPLLILAVSYDDLIVGRLTALETPVEARSIGERQRDARLAWEIISQHSWRGVGLGRYLDAATVLNPEARRVHNVTLLVAAELGVGGLLLWLALALAPIWMVARGERSLAALAPWVAMLVLNFFDTMLWWSSNWQTAILFALLVAHMAERPPGRSAG